MENRWLTWAKQLQSLADNGLHFGESEFDRERYSQVADIATAMLSSLTDKPISTIVNLLNDGEVGYRTPKIDVRAAIIRDDKILLVKENNDGLWTMPGGYADVGLSPSENIVKEVQEEAGIDVTASCLYCVHHKAKHEYDPDIRDFYKFYFLCEENGNLEPKPRSEVSDAAFFSQESLPPLSTGRVIVKNIGMAFNALRQYKNGESISVQFD
jgi:ADP-ribose pyrophosphatase YjhB (NUDIX family)